MSFQPDDWAWIIKWFLSSRSYPKLFSTPVSQDFLRVSSVSIERIEIFEYAWQLGNNWYNHPHRRLGYPSKDIVRSWWNAFPNGVMVIFDPKGIPIGYFSIWPLRKEAFDEFLNGTRTEPDQIQGTDLLPSSSNQLTPWWYLADIIVFDPHLSEKDARLVKAHFIREVLSRLIDAKWFPDSASVISFPVTKEGRNLLNSARFRPINGNDLLSSPLQTPCIGYLSRGFLSEELKAVSKTFSWWKKRSLKQIAHRLEKPCLSPE